MPVNAPRVRFSAVTWNHLCNLFYYPQVGTVRDRAKIADVAGGNATVLRFFAAPRSYWSLKNDNSHLHDY